MKKIQNSKVVWINAIILIIALFDKEFFSLYEFSDTTVLKIVITLTKLTAALNIILRIFFTTKPLSNPLNKE